MGWPTGESEEAAMTVLRVGMLFRLRLVNAGMHDPGGSTPQGMGQR